MTTEYNHTNPTNFSEDECKDAIGKSVTLELTGTVIESVVSNAGPFVRIAIDERFGFGDYTIGIDLDALQVKQATA